MEEVVANGHELDAVLYRYTFDQVVLFYECSQKRNLRGQMNSLLSTAGAISGALGGKKVMEPILAPFFKALGYKPEQVRSEGVPVYKAKSAAEAANLLKGIL